MINSQVGLRQRSIRNYFVEFFSNDIFMLLKILNK
jgi:hypothetical protein